MNTTNQKLIIEEIKDYAITRIEEMIDHKQEVESDELHHILFNEDYYIIGTFQAKEWLNNYDVFDAIDKVMEYENSNFGKVTTEISNPERLANMLAYIIGEKLLMESDTFQDNWNETLTLEILSDIVDELKEA